MNRWDRWYDPENGGFIYDFNPHENLEHALLIVERLKSLGYTYTEKGNYEVALMRFVKQVKRYLKPSLMQHSLSPTIARLRMNGCRES
ncbi:BC1872 family protein [Bacillus sp. 7884-1]|uniref:BC1872 family protein n=1 Tax=Bacillus sp. 7884-1 TaxID=2021693 RepID=UPI0026D92F00|nr:hypothetical protein [Bacillus sp. 7884-1]